MASKRTCSRCEVARPVAEFAKDARLKAGVRSVCKPCDRAATAARRKPGKPKPGALVLVPAFPPAPEPVAVVDVPTRPRHDSLEAEVGRTLAKLEPPPGAADAAVVAALYRVARLLDDSQHGLERVKDAGTLLPKYVQLLRELKATRSSAAAAPARTSGKLASGQF